MIWIGIPLLFSMRMVLLVHFHVSHVGVDPSLGPCKQKVVVLFRSGVVSFYNLLFCVISGDMLNATSIYSFFQLFVSQKLGYISEINILFRLSHIQHVSSSSIPIGAGSPN